MTEHDVVVVGGGPTGMMLAAELTLAGAAAVIVERRAGVALESARSRGLHARTIEVLDMRGIVDRFLAEGRPVQVQMFAGVPLDISDLPTRHGYGMALVQSDVERILAGWLAELGVRFLRERDVLGLAQDPEGVDVVLAGGESLRAQYVVGCDGGRSTVRRAAGIEFPGWDATTRWVIAEVEMTGAPTFGLRGGGGIGPAPDGRIGVTLTMPEVDLAREPTLDDVRDALVRVDGTDHGVHRPHWISTFTDATRQAADYRRGRVLLAGDAAHVHAPIGGQGLNLGVQDAVNLGWKLAQVVRGISPADLLDTYHAERHPVAARALRYTMAQRAAGDDDERAAALRSFLAEVLPMDQPRRHLGAMISGLDLAYDLGDGHPLLGRRMPDLDLATDDGATTVFSLLHDARALLLELDGRVGADVAQWAARVRRVAATCDGPWTLPVLGDVPAPTAVLVRPDGHVAWVGEGSDAGLVDALTQWFGAPPA